MRQTWVRVAALLAGTVALWLVVGVAGSLGTWLWWLIAAAPMAAFIAAPFALYWISAGRTWPTWVAFVPAFVLLMTALAVPGDWYMRTAGIPATAIVGEATCAETREGRCLYSYTLQDRDGQPLEGDFRDTVEYQPGSEMAVLTDPRGLFGPRLAVDVQSRIFEIITLIAFAVYALVAVAAGAIGARRRRSETGSQDLQTRPGRSR